jgi:hypothetical protein
VVQALLDLVLARFTSTYQSSGSRRLALLGPTLTLGAFVLILVLSVGAAT